MHTEGKIGGVAARAAMWSARHRTLAVLGWLAFVVGTVVLSGQLGMIEARNSDYGTGESGRADEIVAAAGFSGRGAGEAVLVQRGEKAGPDADLVAVATEVIDAVRETGLTSQPGAPLASPDRRSMLVTFTVNGDPDTAGDRVGPVLDAVAEVHDRHPDLLIAQAGDASGDKLIGEDLDAGFNRLSILSIPVTLGILLVAFGALVAALLPVGLAVTAVVAAIGLLAVASRVAPTDQSTAHVMLLVGLAVGVDYCLFYIRREREERDRGADAHTALLIAAQTSGRSIWISGLTVIVAMAGMFLTRDTTFVSFAVGTILVVSAAVLGSLTVLPALLSALGDRVDLGRIPGLYRRRGESRTWRAVMGVVLRRPLISALVAVAALGALASPALHLRTRANGLEGLSPHAPIVQAQLAIQRAFPGGTDPAEVVVSAPSVTGPGFDSAVAEFKRRALATGRLHEPITVEVNPAGTVAVLGVGLSGNGTDRESEAALATLREEVIPSTLTLIPGSWVGVTGSTAGSRDFNDRLRSSLPLVFVFVLALAFVLLLVSFRSVVVAVTGVLLNLLSVAAAYGIVVFVFQDGHLEGLLDFTASDGITNWMPLFLFVILFGLSMDYHVFVLSRIREGHDRGLSTRRAVADAITGTAGVITSAAVVMVAVFSLFIILPLVATKEMGLGLAAAVLLDATVVRAVLLPAVMVLLGERNWWLPRWLSWLPRVSHEVPGTAPVRVSEPVGANA